MADSAAANLHHSLLYQTWLSQNFGRTNNETARTYGPKLFAASAFIRTEQAKIDVDPALTNDMVAAKAGGIPQVAAELKELEAAWGRPTAHHSA